MPQRSIDVLLKLPCYTAGIGENIPVRAWRALQFDFYLCIGIVKGRLIPEMIDMNCLYAKSIYRINGWRSWSIRHNSIKSVL
jgi:hypothetical protein